MSVLSTIVPVLDERLSHRDIKLESGSSVTMRGWISTSYNSFLSTFSCPPPSTSTFIDRCFILKLPVTITVGGTTTGSAMFQLGYDALRAYPVSSILSSAMLTLGNQVYTIQPSQTIPYMARFWDESKFSSFPSMLDNYANYVDGAAAINNPLGSYFNAITHNIGRGGYPVFVTTNTSTSGVLTGDIYEPVFIPMLHKDFQQGLGFSNVKTCDLNLTYGTLSRIFSHATSNATISSVSVVPGQPILYQMYTTPPQDYVPRSLTYGSESIEYFATENASSLAANASVTLQSSNIQLGCIPKWVLIFCRESDANKTYLSTDTACRIDNVSINFNNMSGILSSASSLSLYKASVANGLRDTWQQWYGITGNLTNKVGLSGSFLKLYFGKDITLASNVYPGKVGAYNLSLQCTVTNVNQTTAITTPTLYLITSSAEKNIFHPDGHIERIKGMSGESGDYIPFSTASKYYGGSFGDFIGKIGKYVKPVVDFLKKTKLISNVSGMIPHPVAQSISSAARSLGFGQEGEEEGGRLVSKKDLMKRIKQYK